MRYPLPEAQRGLWYAQCIEPENASFNTGEYYTLRGELNRDAFIGAVNSAFVEADGFAVRVHDAALGPEIEMATAYAPVLEVFDCFDNGESYAHNVMRSDLATPIDLSMQSAVRSILFVVNEQHHIWYIRAHHVVTDGYAMRLIADRAADLYSSRLRGLTPVSRELVSYKATLEAEAAYASSNRSLEAKQYWRELLEPHVPAKTLVNGNAAASGYHIEADLLLSAQTCEVLRQVANGARVAWPDVVTAIFALWIERHTGGAVAVPAVASMQRVATANARVATMLMNVVPCPIEIDDSVAMSEFYKAVARRLRDVRKNAHYRGEQIRRDLAMLGGDNRIQGPLINILPFGDAPIFGSLEAEHTVIAPGPVDDLTLEVRGAADGTSLSMCFQANPALYSPNELAILARRFEVFFAAALAADSPSDIPTVTPTEQAELVQFSYGRAVKVDDVTLCDLAATTVSNCADDIALSDGNVSITWGEWDKITAASARMLAARGVKPESIVSVRMRRSVEQVLAIHSIVRAGGAWLPLDPDDPKSRISAITAAASPTVMIVNDEAHVEKDGGFATISAAELLSAVDSREFSDSSDYFPQPPSLDGAAYVIYTSGSTGAPKGVVVTHRAIVNRLLWMANEYSIKNTDRLLLKTPVTFDVSVWELALPLVTGASLTVAPDGAHRDPEALATCIRSADITVAHFVPSMLAAFLDEPSAVGLPWKKVIVSGEALSASLRDRFHSIHSAELHNLYGPTEAAIDVTNWSAAATDTSDPVPIGRPVWNVSTLVLDRAMRMVPAGVEGDLYLGGVQLAREYLARPDLTEKSFVDSQYGRVYRTGDRAVWRNDGALLYLGRDDDQVKLRGQRIEPAEIEHAVRGISGIHDVAVIVREDVPNDKRLVAYVVMGTNVELSTEAIRDVLMRVLPAHYVPSAIVEVEEFPVTRHGKLDRKRLPIPSYANVVAGRTSLTAVESIVAKHFRELLLPDSDDMLAAESDFFSLGGHSLLAVRLVHALRRDGYNVSLGSVFANSTIQAIASCIDTNGAEVGENDRDGLGVMFPFTQYATGAIPLFCIHPAGGLAWCYRPLASRLQNVADVIGIQSRGLNANATMPASLSDLASDYLGVMRSIQSSGPLYLLGWSIGGVIAHEIGVQLERAGEEVGGVVMLDAFPADRWRNASEPDEAEALRALLLIAGVDPTGIPSEHRGSRVAVRKLLESRNHPLAAMSPDAFDGIVRSVLHNNRLVRSHRHGVLASGITYFRADLEHDTNGPSPYEWQPYVKGAIDVHNVTAKHSDMCGDRVSAIVAEHILASRGV